MIFDLHVGKIPDQTMLTWIILDPCKSIATLVSVAPSHLNISQCMKRQLVPWQVLPTFIATLAGKSSCSGPRYPSPVSQCDLRPLWNCPSRHKALATLPCATQLEFRSRQGLWNTQGLEPPFMKPLFRDDVGDVVLNCPELCTGQPPTSTNNTIYTVWTN